MASDAMRLGCQAPAVAQWCHVGRRGSLSGSLFGRGRSSDGASWPAGRTSVRSLSLPAVPVKGGRGGDVKMLFACGILAGMGNIMNFLFFMSIAGFILSLIMWFAGRVDMSRVKHYVRCVFDWGYDRRSGRESLPSRDNERCRIPFGVAIAVGVWATFVWNLSQ